MDDKPIKGLDISAVSKGDSAPSPIPRKRKSAVGLDDEGPNGLDEDFPAKPSVVGTKRTAEEALGHDSPDTKRSKPNLNGTNSTSMNGEHLSVQVIDDSTDGAILIDDD